MERQTEKKKFHKLLFVKTCFWFAVIMIFIGDHSLIQFCKRAKKINDIEEQIQQTNQQIQQTQRTMQMLDNTDSLERFARENYMMHTDKEDVYLVEP